MVTKCRNWHHTRHTYLIILLIILGPYYVLEYHLFVKDKRYSWLRSWSIQYPRGHFVTFIANLTKPKSVQNSPGLRYIYYIWFLSPPVHIARWAHMHRFLSVCPSVRHWTKIHNSESIIDRSMKLYHSSLLTTLWEKFMSANVHGIFALTGRAHCQCQVAFLSPPVHIARWAHMHRFMSVCHTFKNSYLRKY